MVLASLLPSLLSDNSAQGLQQSGWVFLPMLIVIAAITLGGLPASKPTHAASMGFIKSLSQVLADSTYRRLVAVFIANGIASAFPATLFVFFVADVLGAQSLTGLLLGLYFISAAMGVPVWVSLSKKFGRPKAWFAAMLLAVLAFVGAGALGSGDWPWFAVICFASGIAMGADLTIPSSIVADLGESRGHTASYFGVWNLIAKMNLALAAGVALPLLGWMGYTPGTGTQTDILVMAYVLLPLSLKLGAMILLWCWRKPLSFST